MKRRSSLLLVFMVFLLSGCGESATAPEGLVPAAELRVVGFGTANVHARATATEVEGEIVIPDAATTGEVIVRLVTEEGVPYQTPFQLTMTVSSSDNSIAFWVPSDRSIWRGHVVGLKPESAGLTFHVTEIGTGATVMRTPPIPTRH